jgi:lysophospholipase L1-like esterase
VADQSGTGEQRNGLQPGQTLIFLGDHTSPDNAGYVRVMQDVLSRFHPELAANLISAGSPGQTAAGLRRSEFMQLVTSSKPDWLVIGIGLGDALREPSARRLLDDYRKRQAELEADEAELTFGPEFRVKRSDMGPVSDIGREPEPTLFNLDTFQKDLTAALSELQTAGVRPALLTTIIVGNDLQNPVNGVLKQYNRAIKAAASEQSALLVDVEKAFRDVFDRAANYKQKVSLTGPNGDLNAQGQALLARTLLAAFKVLPYPGYRPTP